MKRFIITSAMLLMMGLAVPSFAAQQDQKKEEPHPAPPAHQEHQQPAHQAHPPQAAQPGRPAAAPAQHQQAPAARPERQGAQQPSHQHHAPPQQQPAPQATHPEGRAPEGHPQAHAPQGASHPSAHHTPPQQVNPNANHTGTPYNGPAHGGTHHTGAQQNPQQVRSGFAHSHARNWNSEHRTWVQRGGYHGYRVPDDRYRLYFGRPHPFRIYGLPLQFIGGYPRFQYDGYWVTFVDPWPEFWPSDWYQTDNVYLDYADDGYYLYDLDRGGPGIAVEVAD